MAAAEEEAARAAESAVANLEARAEADGRRLRSELKVNELYKADAAAARAQPVFPQHNLSLRPTPRRHSPVGKSQLGRRGAKQRRHASTLDAHLLTSP